MQPTAGADGTSMISMRQVRKQYADGTVAVHELDLDVGRGEVAVLIGPSGCGKTTTMRMINRLVDPSSGRIYLDGDDVTAADPVKLRRSMGYVIQQVGLFPHQTVSDNIATVPKLLGWDRRRTSARIGELLELVGLDPSRFAKRYPHELSGGQRQRVGVARALAADPPVLLMDEPFGAVDPIARDRLQAEFLRLQEQVRKTVVFVTHDMDEAVRLGDRVAVMREGGHLEQYAEPAALLTSPVNDFVADFVGARQTLRRLSVVRLGWDAAEPWPTVDADGDAAGADLRGATHAVVLDGDAPVGWLAASAATGSGVARERMRPAAVVDRAATVEQAMAQLLATGGPGVVVTDGGRYAGVVTATGLIDAAREPTPEGTADDE